MSDRRTENNFLGQIFVADLVASALDIGISLFSTLLFVAATLNLVGFLLQVRAKEEDIRVKFPTFLNLIGTVLIGLWGLVSLALPGEKIAQNCILLLSIVFLLLGTYLGLKKHAVRYLDSKGQPLKVSYSGMDTVRAKIRRNDLQKGRQPKF
jgi:hypothetical protein